jgi:hypothetical protein
MFRRFLIVMFAVCTLVFMGCSNDDDDDDTPPGAVAFSVAISPGGGGTKYFSFARRFTDESGAVTATNNKNWDIAFSTGRYIYTNSGATATDLGSNGGGGVWYTGKTVFADVTSAADADFAKNYAVDTKKWVGGMSSAAEQNLNVMTFVGYGSGDGNSETTAFSASNYLYDQEEYYYQQGSMGAGVSFPMRMRVYIIQHGTGSTYTKIQITEVSGSGTDAAPRVFSGYYQTIPAN